MQQSRRQWLKLNAKMGVGMALLPHWPLASGNTLIQRKIPSTGEAIPVIGMGTWRTFDVGDSAPERNVRKEVLREFARQGGKVIDSSPMYGSSQRVIGDLTTELGIQKSLFLVTKVWTSGEEAGKRQMRESMQEMQANPLRLMQVHNLLDFKTHYPTLVKWKNEGVFNYIGITHYLPGYYDELARLIQTYPLDFVQFAYSVNTRDAEKKLLSVAAEKGVAVIINRPFEEGSLFRQVRGRPAPKEVNGFPFQGWASFFLKYIISHPAVTCTIPATTQPVHMRENMAAAYGDLPDEATRRKMVAYVQSL